MLPDKADNYVKIWNENFKPYETVRTKKRFKLLSLPKPANLSVIVLDNGHFGETGMQASHTNSCVDLAKIAAASGFKRAETIETDQELERFLQLFQDASGPSFAAIKVEQEAPPRSLPILDGVELKNRFRRTFNLFPK